MAGSPPAVIRETRRGQTEFMAEKPEEPPGGSQSVRSSDEAGNDRGAKGTQESGSMTNRTTDKEPKRVPVRAYRRRSQPSVIGLVDTEGLCVILRDEAKSRSLSTENPLTGKPDAGNPPVRFGGRGGANLAIPTPIIKSGHRPIGLKLAF